ncbi:ATP-binding mismatch repair protein [Rhizophlyctis rosea]|nr:ATP-binding mismatch repair protein [Rhizophlyctis rosea]
MGSYDRNVTPDKRTVFIEDENELLASLKDSLREFLETFCGTYASQTVASSGFTSITSHFTQPEALSSATSSPTSTSAIDSNELPVALSDDDEVEDDEALMETSSQDVVMVEDNNVHHSSTSFSKSLTPLPWFAGSNLMRLSVSQKPSKLTTRALPKASHRTTTNVFRSPPRPVSEPQSLHATESAPATLTRTDSTSYISSIQEDVFAHFDSRQLKRKRPPEDNDHNSQNSDDNRFQLGVTMEKDTLAVEELNRNVTKDDFEKMEVLGQFNLGFIIARLGDDLFIIDQHAR